MHVCTCVLRCGVCFHVWCVPVCAHVGSLHTHVHMCVHVCVHLFVCMCAGRDGAGRDSARFAPARVPFGQVAMRLTGCPGERQASFQAELGWTVWEVEW